VMREMASAWRFWGVVDVACSGIGGIGSGSSVREVCVVVSFGCGVGVRLVIFVFIERGTSSSSSEVDGVVDGVVCADITVGSSGVGSGDVRASEVSASREGRSWAVGRGPASRCVGAWVGGGDPSSKFYE